MSQGADDASLKDGVVHLTESAIIDGAGSTVLSTPTWVDSEGMVNNDSTLERRSTIIVSPAMRFLLIGNSGEDNSGIEVTVRNLNGQGLNTFAIARQNASLTVENVNISGTRSITPTKDPVIDGNFTALTIRDSSITDAKTYDDVIYVDDSFYAFSGVISEQCL